MKQVQVMQINNGWVVSYPKITMQNGQAIQQPVSVHCPGANEVASLVRQLCSEPEQPSLGILNPTK